MLEETPRDPVEPARARKRSPVPARWMWTWAGLGWGAVLGMLACLKQGLPGIYKSPYQLNPDPLERAQRLFNECSSDPMGLALAGIIMGTATGGAMTLLSAWLVAWPRRFLYAFVLGALSPAALPIFIRLPSGGETWWLLMMIFQIPMGCAIGLLATASVWLVTLLAARKREATTSFRPGA